MLKYAVRELVFQDGTSEELPESGIIVVVGPNNSGKSVLLSEINHIATQDNPSHQAKWLESLKITRNSDPEAFDQWFETVAKHMPEGTAYAGRYGIWDVSTGGQFIDHQSAKTAWSSNWPLGVLAPRLVVYLDAMSRPAALQAGPARDPLTPALNPIHRIWDDRDLQQKLSRMIKRAFGYPISMKRYSQTPQILIGEPNLPDEVLPPSKELLDEYARLRTATGQGDGVRSFIGLLLNSIAHGASITLIDEPEAFLHPPQARLLGKYLSEETDPNTQVIVATHSSELLEGVLAGNEYRQVKIIRVSEERANPGRRTRSVLPPERVANLWNDPLLRYSRLLSSLLHKGAVICESDGDCRFYESSLDVYLNKTAEHDLLFTYMGGKSRIPLALREMKSFQIATAAIVDLDALNEKSYMKNLIESAGGEWSKFEDDFKAIHLQVDERSSYPTVGSLKEAALKVISRRNESRVTDEESKAISKALKLRSGWSEVKRSGLSAFEGGAATAVVRMLEGLAQIGIFLVPVGELERWFKNLTAPHGIAYATAVFEGKHHEHPTEELTNFIGKVANYFGLHMPDIDN